MREKCAVLHVVLSILCTSLSANLPLASSTEKDLQHCEFQSIKQLADERWQAFQTQRGFKTFSIGQSDEVLEEEFKTIYSTRKALWATDGYERAQNLIDNDLVRAPGCVAFAYNNTVPYYNASTICLRGNYYIACEGPRSKDIPKFFDLLVSHQVTHLVRLTDSYEGETKKCHPYWEGLLRENQLNIPTEEGIYSLRAFDMADWKDNHGVDPQELLAVVLQVRQELEERNDGLLVVHCSAGVGRTGTFLAGLAIVDAIDQNEPFSIEEIVYRLSLQRVSTVAKRDQYLTLYRLAERYLEQSDD